LKSWLSDARKNKILPKFERKVGYGQRAPPGHPQTSPISTWITKKTVFV
jgi:hypothetical protein